MSDYVPPSSIAADFAEVAETAAAQGYQVRPKYQQPYGWELFTGDKVIKTGSLDQLLRYLQDEPPRQPYNVQAWDGRTLRTVGDAS